MIYGDNMELEELVEAIKEPLKSNGFKKRNTNWYKIGNDLTIVFNIQKSQYGDDTWYYNFGIGINELETKPITTIARCHITDRIDSMINGKEIAPNVLLKAILSWESKYGKLSDLRIKAIENNLPKMTTRQAISYLTTIRF